MERFARLCRFNPYTGCVEWIGGKTAGGGKIAPSLYGVFKYEGKRWSAHRWAAKYIHGLDIDGLHVDHCCPHGSNTLCQQHLQAVTQEVNTALYWMRVEGRAEEEPAPLAHLGDDGIPWYSPPLWLRTLQPAPVILEAPF